MATGWPTTGGGEVEDSLAMPGLNEGHAAPAAHSRFDAAGGTGGEEEEEEEEDEEDVTNRIGGIVFII